MVLNYDTIIFQKYKMAPVKISGLIKRLMQLSKLLISILPDG
jgi:hypothetical protein